MNETGEYERLPKKEVFGLERERAKLQSTLVGIKNMDRLPSAVFIIDPRRSNRGRGGQPPGHPDRGHRRHQLRSRRDRLPVPGNDDAIRSVRLITSRIADAIIEGSGSPQAGGGGGDPRLGLALVTEAEMTKSAEAGVYSGRSHGLVRRTGEGPPGAHRSGG